MGSPASSVAVTSPAASLRRASFPPAWQGRRCARRRRAELIGQLVVELRRIAARPRHQLDGQQVHDDAVLVGRPHACRRGAGTTRPALSSPPKPSDPSSSPETNHLKPTGTSTSGRAEAGRHAVDDAAAHDGLAHCRIGRATPAPVLNRYDTADGQDSGWDSCSPAARVTMPWRSASASLPNATSKRSFSAIRRRHRVRRRAVHADPAVPVDRHEARTSGRPRLFTTATSIPYRSTRCGAQ